MSVWIGTMNIRQLANLTGLTFVCAASVGTAHAQTAAKPAAAAAAPVAKPGFTYTAEKVNYRSNGIRLEGSAARPARIQSPEIDVTALAIAFDVEGNGIKEVRAVGGTILKLSLSSKTGGQPARIESKSDKATLVPAERKLVLAGGVNGFYQLGDGPKNNLRGQTATLTYLNQVPDLTLEGGKDGVLVTIPAEASTTPGAFGAITVTALKANFDGDTGLGRFTGNARAFSIDGPNKLDVTAPEFQIIRGKDGTLSQLRTVGRTNVKVDLPPDAVKPAAPTPATAPAPVKPGTATPAAKSSAVSIGSPTHVEAIADGAVMNRATSTLTFDGNVKGFYRLSGADGKPQDFNFSGNKATFKFDDESKGGLSVDVTGEPVSIQVPGLNLGL